MKKALRVVFLILVFAFLYAPIIVLIVFSFNSSNSQTTFSGFSLRWYAQLFGDSSIMTALWNTLVVAAVASVVSTVIGTAAAIGIYGMKRRARNAVMNATYLPVINPDIITAVSLMMVFSMMRMPFGLVTLCAAHITFDVPYVILAVLPRLRSMNISVYEAALDLGAKPSRALRQVVLPQIMPGVITGALMSFTLSIDDFIISYFTRGAGTQTLPTLIYAMTRRKITPKVNALSAIMFVTVLALLIIVNVRKERGAAAEKEEEKNL